MGVYIRLRVMLYLRSLLSVVTLMYRVLVFFYNAKGRVQINC